MDENDVTNEVVKTKKKGKHDKPKPWDDDPNIDRWKVEKFDPSWNEGGMLEVSSFSTLFPQYREKYLQEAWPLVKSSLKEFGISAELNLVCIMYECIVYAIDIDNDFVRVIESVID
jgi:ribosomal RNA assembly protein